LSVSSSIPMKFVIKFLLAFSIINILFSFTAFCAGTTLLPQPVYNTGDQSNEEYCLETMKRFNSSDPTLEERFNKFSEDQKQTFLSCAITTGEIHLWMLPYYIVYWIEFMIQMSGILAVLMFVVGGIFYILGGGMLESISKDKGKKYMTWALTGMALCFLAWVIVNIVLNFLSQ